MRAKELLNMPTLTPHEIAKKHGVSPGVIFGQLKKGIAVELEHTYNEAIAKEIALDHLAELPDYYSKLATIEESVILNESLINAPLVVVDVQPAYAYHINFGQKLARLLEKRTGETLMYVNAEDSGTSEDTMQEIQEYWWRMGLENETMANFTWFDKGYGNLREAMDTGASDGDIVAVIREMFRQNINDSRELFDEDHEQQLEAFGEDNIEWIRNGISIMELNGFDKLKQMSPFYLCGGGKDECLKEVMLMCNALNIKYKLLSEFIY